MQFAVDSNAFRQWRRRQWQRRFVPRFTTSILTKYPRLGYYYRLYYKPRMHLYGPRDRVNRKSERYFARLHVVFHLWTSLTPSGCIIRARVYVCVCMCMCARAHACLAYACRPTMHLRHKIRCCLLPFEALTFPPRDVSYRGCREARLIVSRICSLWETPDVSFSFSFSFPFESVMLPGAHTHTPIIII